YLVRERLDRERRQQNLGSGQTLPAQDLDKLLKMPVPRAPEAAHAGDRDYEIPGEPTPTTPRSRPRARTHGDDEIAADVKKANVNTSVPATPAANAPMSPEPAKKESTTASILRRFSTRRHVKHEPRTPLTPALSLHGS